MQILLENVAYDLIITMMIRWSILYRHEQIDTYGFMNFAMASMSGVLYVSAELGLKIRQLNEQYVS